MKTMDTTTKKEAKRKRSHHMGIKQPPKGMKIPETKSKRKQLTVVNIETILKNLKLSQEGLKPELSERLEVKAVKKTPFFKDTFH